MSPPLQNNQAELCGFHRSSRIWLLDVTFGGVTGPESAPSGGDTTFKTFRLPRVCRRRQSSSWRLLLHWVGSINRKVLPLPQQLLKRAINQSAGGDGAACFPGPTAELRISFNYLFNFFWREKLSQVSDAVRILLGDFPRLWLPAWCVSPGGKGQHGGRTGQHGGRMGQHGGSTLCDLTRQRSSPRTSAKVRNEAERGPWLTGWAQLFPEMCAKFPYFKLVMSYQQINMINDACVPLSVIKFYESGLGCDENKGHHSQLRGALAPSCGQRSHLQRFDFNWSISSYVCNRLAPHKWCTWSARSEMLRDSSTMTL